MKCPHCGKEIKFRGLGETQFIMSQLPRQKILSFLRNGEWRRFGEILEATKVSPVTLSKHLKKLVSADVVERKVFLNDSYPPPVCYRLRNK